MATFVVNLCRVIAGLAFISGIFVFLQPFLDPMSGSTREGVATYFAAAVAFLIVSVVVDLLAKIERGVNAAK